jgi:hypothetical protein
LGIIFVRGNTFFEPREIPMNITDLNFLETVDTVDVSGGRRNRVERNKEIEPITPNVNITIAPQITINIINNLQIVINNATIISLGDSFNNINQNGVASFSPTVNLNS